jgi:hypothetical protein
MALLHPGPILVLPASSGVSTIGVWGKDSINVSRGI